MGVQPAEVPLAAGHRGGDVGVRRGVQPARGSVAGHRRRPPRWRPHHPGHPLPPVPGVLLLQRHRVRFVARGHRPHPPPLRPARAQRRGHLAAHPPAPACGHGAGLAQPHGRLRSRHLPGRRHHRLQLAAGGRRLRIPRGPDGAGVGAGEEEGRRPRRRRRPRLAWRAAAQGPDAARDVRDQRHVHVRAEHARRLLGRRPGGPPRRRRRAEGLQPRPPGDLLPRQHHGVRRVPAHHLAAPGQEAARHGGQRAVRGALRVHRRCAGRPRRGVRRRELQGRRDHRLRRRPGRCCSGVHGVPGGFCCACRGSYTEQ
uniref:Uncharacterized protein n=1 Tax=Arundo donax TaxID=35708 RepID=A0A0A9AKD4_ARUDO